MGIGSLTNLKIPTLGTPRLRTMDPRSAGGSSTEGTVMCEPTALSRLISSSVGRENAQSGYQRLPNIIDRYA